MVTCFADVFVDILFAAGVCDDESLECESLELSIVDEDGSTAFDGDKVFWHQKNEQV